MVSLVAKKTLYTCVGNISNENSIKRGKTKRDSNLSKGEGRMEGIIEKLDVSEGYLKMMLE